MLLVTLEQCTPLVFTETKIVVTIQTWRNKNKCVVKETPWAVSVKYPALDDRSRFKSSLKNARLQLLRSSTRSHELRSGGVSPRAKDSPRCPSSVDPTM